MSKLKIYLKSILIPILVGLIISFITRESTLEYVYLQKPILSPSAWVFPVVWTILYILMGISYGYLKSNDLIDKDTNNIYYVQLGVNALWSIFFFSLKWRLFAFFWIILLVLLIIDMIKKFYNKNKVAGLLQIPYLIWVLFASYLNISIYFLNR